MGPENAKVELKSQSTKLQLQQSTTQNTISQSTVKLVSPGADDLLTADWLSMADGRTILGATFSTNEYTHSSNQSNQVERPIKPLLLDKSEAIVATLGSEVVSETQNPDSQSIAPLSFASGSLRYSKRSLLTVKPKSPGVLDDATIGRIRKRRDLIEELLQTEEIYISELRTLLNVICFFFLIFCFMPNSLNT